MPTWTMALGSFRLRSTSRSRDQVKRHPYTILWAIAAAFLHGLAFAKPASWARRHGLSAGPASESGSKLHALQMGLPRKLNSPAHRGSSGRNQPLAAVNMIGVEYRAEYPTPNT